MNGTNKIQIVKDLPNKKIKVIRLFDAPVAPVWRAWTEDALLDLWWAPKPYRAETKSMDFRTGGYWLYAMVSPDNIKTWCKVEYTAINAPKSFQTYNLFCDENGNQDTSFPSMDWKNDFMATETGTKVVVEISFASVADFEKIIGMGFEAGFTMGLGNLEELLQKQKAVQ